MKGIKVLLDICLIILVVINLFFLGITTLYGGITRGIFYSVLTDRPEFSHISDSQLAFINIASTFLIVSGTILPLVILILPIFTIKRKRGLTACLSLVPLLFLLTRLLIFPEPDSFTQTSLGKFQVRKYKWDTRNGQTVKCWISEKPSSAYNYQDRIKWLPLAQPEKNK
jgi:hypothetical protein